MKALSLRQASRCEMAVHAKCRCRCHGELHGSKRGVQGIEPVADLMPPREFFETLPGDDPHHVRSRAEINKRRKLQRAAAKARAVGQQTLWPILEEA